MLPIVSITFFISYLFMLMAMSVLFYLYCNIIIITLFKILELCMLLVVSRHQEARRSTPHEQPTIKNVFGFRTSSSNL